METCATCAYWSVPRGFQYPGDYYWTQLRLLEALEAGSLRLESASGFPAPDATERSRPSQSLSALFSCTACGRTFDLFLDVDACRGSLAAA